MSASKHFDPQLGIDAHAYLAPPGVWPTVHIGFVFDPFDYLPTIEVSPDNPLLKVMAGVDDAMQAGMGLIGESTRAPEVPSPPGATVVAEAPEEVPMPLGATVEVGGVRRANAGTGGIDFHVLVGAPMPVIRAPMGPQFDDELFMGSRIVLADGEPFSRIAMPVLGCNIVGMVPPLRIRKLSVPIPPSLMLPTTINVAVPTNVFIGGPPTISWSAAIMKSFMKALGRSYKAAARRIFRKMPSGFLKCKVLRAEPVDIRDGSVAVAHQDFDIPGRLPLTWTREYSSSSGYSGACGHGWQTPADTRLELAADGSILMVDNGSIAFFEQLPAGEGEAHTVRDIFDGARLSVRRLNDEDRLCVRLKGGLIYVFTKPPASRSAADAGRLAANDAASVHLPIEAIEDLCGNHWRFVRASGGLLRIVESGIDGLPGRTIEVESSHGRIDAMSLRDPATGKCHPLVRYRYKEGDLVAALDAFGVPRTFEYAQHHMLRHTDRLGLSFHYAYDSRWRVVHAWGDGGLYDYRFAYDELLRETRLHNSLGAQWVVRFDANQLPLCEIDPLDGVTVFEYDTVGRTVAVVDPMGLRTAWVYDERGNVLKVTQPDGSTVANEFDADDQMVRATDAAGNAWRQAHDARGLLQQQVDPLGAVSRFTWDRYGQLAQHTDARGAAVQLRFDRHGQLSEMVDVLGHASRYEHDVLGRLLSQTNPLAQTTYYQYDAKGRLLRICSPDGAQVQCDYDAEDQLIRYVDEAGAQTRLKYVGIGQIGTRTQPDGHTVQYRYDSEEQLVAVVNQRGEEYRLRRDPLGRIVEETDYWGQARLYHYDAAGRLTATTDPLGQRLDFATDKLGRIVKKTLPDVRHPGQQVQEQFAYDRRGQLVELRNAHRTATRRFDALGQLLEEVQDGFRVGYGYDAVGNRVLRETSAGNRVAFGYDLRGQVIEVAINDDAPITIERDALGRATREQLSAHVQRQFQYDSRSLLTAQSVLKDAAPLFETRYDYDRAGNLTHRRDSIQGVDEYRYDVLGRLLQHTDPKGRVERFINDPAGDRLATRIQQVQMRKVAGGDEQQQQQVQWTREGTYEGVHYVFDRAGDLVRKGSPYGPAPDDLELIWDANHRLAESRKGGQATHYGYDPLGRRVFKRNPTHTTWFYWDGDALLGEVKQAHDEPRAAPLTQAELAAGVRPRQPRSVALHGLVREYVYGEESFVPFALIDKANRPNEADERLLPDTALPPVASVFHYQVDPNGCPTRLTDGHGGIAWSASYAAWGNITASHASGIANPVRFQGQYFDEKTGLHYNRYRYYDPYTGAYVSKDPIGLAGGFNPYRYAPNATHWIDPRGLATIRIDPRTGIRRMPKWLGTETGWQRQHLVPFAVWRDTMPRLSKLGLSMTDVHGAHNVMMMPMFEGMRPAQYPNMGLHRNFHQLHRRITSWSRTNWLLCSTGFRA